MKPAGEATFHIANVPWGEGVVVHFKAAASGQPRRFERSYRSDKPVVYEAVQQFTPTATQFAEYAGSYVSEEIDPVYRVALESGMLELLRLKHKPDVLQPAVRDAFFGEIGTLHFTRDSQQRISGFILNGDRVRDFRFTKRPD